MLASSVRRRLARAAFGAAIALAGIAASAADLTVSAAASLTNAFRELGTAFEAQNPGTKVVFNFAASDALLAQISRGAPVDVFASADQETMDRADGEKLLAPGSRRNFVSNSLVVVQPSDATMRLSTLADLRGVDVKRIAIGAPAGVPAGRYAKSALEKAQLWAAVESKAVFAQSVRQALDYVARGEVEAGFVYASDAAIQRQRTALARALAASPQALLLDEPFSAPDPELRQRTRPGVDAVLRSLDIPIITITHDPADLATFGDETLYLRDGAIVERPAVTSA